MTPRTITRLAETASIPNLEDVDFTPLIVANGPSGAISSVTADAGNTGDGTVAFANEPTADLDLVIDVTTTGVVGVMAFRYSIDGGTNYSDPISSVGQTSGVAFDFIENMTITLTDGTSPFTLGDKWYATMNGSMLANYPVLVTPDSVDTIVKGGHLYDAIKMYFNASVNTYGSPGRCYAIRPTNDNAGSLGTVTSVITGNGTIGIAGTPTRDMEIKVEIILVGGQCATAKYRYSINGGDTWSDTYTTPASGTGVYIGYGVTVTFTDGSAPSYNIGDYAEVTATAPYATDILKAFSDSLSTILVRDDVKYNGNFGMILVAEDTEYSEWLYMTEILDQIEDAGYPQWCIMQPDQRTSVETVSAWVTDTVNEATPFFDKRIAITPFSINTNLYTNKNFSSILMGVYSVVPVGFDAGDINYVNLLDSGITSVVDKDALRAYRDTLDEARYVVVYDKPNIDGDFIANSNLMSTSGSSYKYIRDIRVANRVRRLAQVKGDTMLKRTYLNNASSLIAIATEIETYILNNTRGQVTDINVEVLSSLTDLQNGTVRLKIVIDKTLLLDELDITVQYSA
jgi:hypothetical protein